jgi:hypothetical protein
MTRTPKKDLMALSRAREKAAMDWYAQHPEARYELALCTFANWDGAKFYIKTLYAHAQGFDSWDEFCKSDDPERWKN